TACSQEPHPSWRFGAELPSGRHPDCRHLHVIRENLARESTMMTDEGTYYRELGREFARHDTVNHKLEEYVRGDAHTTTAQNFFSIFKRGMHGVYQHCS